MLTRISGVDLPDVLPDSSARRVAQFDIDLGERPLESTIRCSDRKLL